MSSQFDTGMGTTPGMWGMVSDALEDEKLPESVNKAIHALCEGRSSVVPDTVIEPMQDNTYLTTRHSAMMGVGPNGTFTEIPKSVMDGLYKIMCGISSDFSKHEVSDSAKPGMQSAMRFVLEYGERNGFGMRD